MDAIRRISTVVIFTAEFPFGGYTEGSFIKPELRYWAECCERVLLVPLAATAGAKGYDMESLPANIAMVDNLVPVVGRRLRRMRRFADWRLWRGIDASNMLSSATFGALALEYAGEVRSLVDELQLDLSTTLFYTFWFDSITVALGMLRRRHWPELKAVSRIHGYELRDVRSKPLYRLALAELEGCYAVSEEGASRMRRLFPEYASKIVVRRLGVTSSGIDRPLFASEAVRFISVSRLSAIKRVYLNFALVKHVARLMPERRVEWLHVGDGECMTEISRMISGEMPENLSVKLAGALPNEVVHHLYRTWHPWWTILMSEHEGLPVTLCESASYGVPMIATAVGGVPEIVRDGVNGLLGEPKPDIEALARRVAEVSANRPLHMRMGESAYAGWQAGFDADTLRKQFVDDLMKWKWL